MEDTTVFNQFNSQFLTNILNDKVNIIVSKVEHNSIELTQNSEDIKDSIKQWRLFVTN